MVQLNQIFEGQCQANSIDFFAHVQHGFVEALGFGFKSMGWIVEYFLME